MSCMPAVVPMSASHGQFCLVQSTLPRSSSRTNKALPPLPQRRPFHCCPKRLRDQTETLQLNKPLVTKGQARAVHKPFAFQPETPKVPFNSSTSLVPAKVPKAKPGRCLEELPSLKLRCGGIRDRVLFESSGLNSVLRQFRHRDSRDAGDGGLHV